MIEALFFILICSLGMNLYPLINVAVMMSFVPLYLKYGRFQKNPCPTADPVKWCRYAYAYWIVSYFMTVGSVSNFFSYDFLRRDGDIFFAYLPLILIGAYGLKPAQTRWLIEVYLAVMSGLAAIGAFQFAAAVGLLPNFLPLVPDSLMMVSSGETSGVEFHALIAAHNAAGGAYGIASIVALAVFLFAEKKPRIFSWPTVALALTLTGLAMTKSRGAYVGFCAAAALVIFRSKADWKRALKPLIVVIIPLLISLVMLPEVTSRVTSIGAGDADPNILIRLELWPRALADFISSPVVGIGFSRFNDDNLQFYGIRNLLYVATGGEIVNSDAHAHNSFLHFAAEGGIVGLTLMVSIWVAIYRWAQWAGNQFQVGTFEYALSRALRGCVVLECFISLTDHMMGSAVTTVAIFSLFGLLRNVVGYRNRQSILLARASHKSQMSPAGPVSGGIFGPDSVGFST